MCVPQYWILYRHSPAYAVGEIAAAYPQLLDRLKKSYQCKFSQIGRTSYQLLMSDEANNNAQSTAVQNVHSSESDGHLALLNWIK